MPFDAEIYLRDNCILNNPSRYFSRPARFQIRPQTKAALTPQKIQTLINEAVIITPELEKYLVTKTNAGDEKSQEILQHLRKLVQWAKDLLPYTINYQVLTDVLRGVFKIRFIYDMETSDPVLNGFISGFSSAEGRYITISNAGNTVYIVISHFSITKMKLLELLRNELHHAASALFNYVRQAKEKNIIPDAVFAEYNKKLQEAFNADQLKTVNDQYQIMYPLVQDARFLFPGPILFNYAFDPELATRLGYALKMADARVTTLARLLRQTQHSAQEWSTLRYLAMATTEFRAYDINSLYLPTSPSYPLFAFLAQNASLLPLSVVTQTKIPIEMPIKKIIPLAGKRLLGLHSAKLPNALPQFSSAADFVGYWRNFREISCGGECFPDFYSKLQQGIYDFNVLKELMETPSYMETLDGKLLKMLAPEFCSFFSARTLVDYCERKPLPQTPLLIEAVSSQRENPQTSAATQSAIPGWLGTFRYLTTQARATTTAAYQTLYGLFSNSQGRETFASQNSLSSRQNPIYNEVPKPSSATTEFFGSTSAAITPPKFVGHMTASDADSTAVAVNDPLPEVGGAQPIYPFELAFILAATLLTKPLHRLSSWLPSNQTRALSDEEKNRLQQQQKDLELIRKGFPENYTALKNSPYFPNDLLQDTDYLSRKTSHMITKMLRTNQTTSGDYELVTSYMDKLNARSNQLNTVLANDELTYDTQKRESGEYTMTLNTFLARNTSSFTANINRAHLTPTTDALLPIILPRLGNNP